MTQLISSDFPSPDLPNLADWQNTLGWMPNSKQLQQLQTLYALVLEGNRQFNLTRITEPIEFAEKHLWDSLRGIQSFFSTPDSLFSASCKAIDIGTGAGFPGVPIAIARPDWTLVLLDSTRKKLNFLDQVLLSLGCTNASTLVGRAEEIGHQTAHRECYDLALIRAVASAPVCAEYALPLLKPSGLAVLYRGQWTMAEATALTIAAECLGGTVEAIEQFKTPITQSDRHCIYLRKTAPTPAALPRSSGIPTQKPLGIT